MLTIAPGSVSPQQITIKCGRHYFRGHTDCTFNQAAEAVDAGATCATHLLMQ